MELNERYNEISRRRELLLAGLLLLMGLLLRTSALGSLPLGLNQDEASVGYDAWSLLNYGMDRCGNRWPVLLESWGSGQNALYAYLCIPFIAVLGLTVTAVRLPMALSGVAALVFMWLLARKRGGARFGLTALLLLAVCPWHIMASRWALESNLMPTLLLGGIYFLVLGAEKPRFLYAAAVMLALCLYAYGTAFFFLLLFLPVAAVWLWGKLRLRDALPPALLFVLIALPITLCQFRNALGLPEVTFLGLTLTRLTETRQSAVSVFGGGGLKTLLKNFALLIEVFFTQSDGLSYNSSKLCGLFYFFGPTFTLLGIFCSLRRRLYAYRDLPMLCALLCGFLCAFFIEGNVNRLNMLWLPAVYFQAVAACELLRRPKQAAPALCTLLLGLCLMFSLDYAENFKEEPNSNFFPGLGDCIEYVDAREPESAFISYYVSQPEIFVLFYTQTPSPQYQEKVVFHNPDGAFRWVQSMGVWSFGAADEAHGEYLILNRNEALGRDVLYASGYYVVCAG